MAPLPKKRHSTRRQGKRRAAIHLALPNLVKCPNCQEYMIPHRVCSSCGQYKGKDIVIKKSVSTDENKKRSETSKKNPNR